MKKSISLMLIVSILISVFLVGCGNNKDIEGSTAGESTSKDQNKDADGEKKVGKATEVNYWHSMGSANGERVKAMVEAFNDSQDEVVVIETFQGGYEEASAKLQQAIAADTVPEIAMIERAFVERFAAADALEDLTPYMKESGLSRDMFVEGLMGYSEYNDDGKLVSVPFNRSTPILYYNKTAFKEVGLDPEKGPETWDELKEFAEKLTIRDGDNIERYGMTWPIVPWPFKAFVAQAGGRTLNEERTDIDFYENGIGVKVLNFWTDLRDEGLMKIPPSKDGHTIARQSFINGEVTMFIESTSLIGTLLKSIDDDFELGAAFLPKNEVRAMPTGGANVAMMSKGENKEEAWKFLEWMLVDPEGGAAFCEASGYLPFTKQMVESSTIQDLWKESPQFKVAFDQLEYAVDTEQHLYWSEIKSEIVKSIQAVMIDNEDPETAMENLSKEAKRILAQ